MTVTTFFPDAHVETTSVDGQTQRAGVNEIYATIRGGAGTGSTDTGSTQTVAISTSTTTDQYDILRRGILLFDTASLPDGDTIDSATFELVVTSKLEQLSPADSVSLVESTPASNTGLIDADYGQTGTTKQATDLTIASLTADSSTFNVWTLNATGEASIDATGVTKFGLRLASDADNNEPTWGSSDTTQFLWATAEEILAGDKRPKLVVTHSAAAADTEIAVGLNLGAQPIQVQWRTVAY